MDLKPLAPVQTEVLSSLRRRAEAGIPMPSYRELCDEFGWRSTGTVRDHLRALARKGYIGLSGPGHRSIRLTERLAVVGVPLILEPIVDSTITDEKVVRRIPVPAEWSLGGVHFALRMRDDSMLGAGIYDGDYLIARQQQSPELGAIVVAVVEGTLTVKRLKRRGPQLVLQPENPDYRPVHVREGPPTIQGVVVGLLRDFQTSNRPPDQLLTRAKLS